MRLCDALIASFVLPAIVPSRPCGRDETGCQVARDAFGRPFRRRAEAAAARHQQLDLVAGLHFQGGKARDGLAVPPHFAHDAGRAAVQARRMAEHLVRPYARLNGRRRDIPEGDALADAAAATARPRGVHAVFLVPNQNGGLRFHDLDRRYGTVVGKRDGRHTVQFPHRAASAVRQAADGKRAVAFRFAMYGKGPDGPAARLGVRAQQRPHGAEQHLIDVVRGFGPGLHGIGEIAIQDAAAGRRDVDRLEEALVVRYLRRQRALEGIHGGGESGVVDAVDRTQAGLGRRAGVVHVDVVAGDADDGMQMHALDVPVDIQPEFVRAVRQGLDAAAHQRFGAAVDDARQRHQIVHGVIEQELAQAADADLMGPDDGPDIPQHQFGDAAVLADDVEEECVGLARGIDFRRRDPNAFGEHVVGFDVAPVSADVREMGHGPHERDGRALMEDRRQQNVVGQMARADPGIVGAEHVAFLQGLQRIGLQQASGRAREHDAEIGRREPGLAQGIPVPIHQDAGEIPAFAHDGGEGGLDRREIDLVHDRDQALPLDLQADRIDSVPRLRAGGPFVHGACSCHSCRVPCLAQEPALGACACMRTPAAPGARTSHSSRAADSPHARRQGS